MSTLAVTADHNLSSTTPISVHTENVMQRARRALVMSGVTALIIGAFLGFIQANPSVLASRFGYRPEPLIVVLVGGGVIGLVSGLIAGLALRGRTVLLRWGVAMFALVVGLIFSEMVFGMAVGVTLDGALRVIRDDVEAAQIGVGAMMSLIGSLAGWQKARRSLPISTSTGAIVAPPVATPVRGWRQLRSPSQTSGSHVSSPLRPSRKRSTPQVELTTPQAVVKPAVRSKRGWLTRRRKVHLGKQSTNVCPYCLEEVLPRDPRGKVVCDICGAPHHGDCWAITGKCEVPHLQT
jgi:hypothetical protein